MKSIVNRFILRRVLSSFVAATRGIAFLTSTSFLAMGIMPAAAQPTGTITGRVENREARLSLENARVVEEGTNMSIPTFLSAQRPPVHRWDFEQSGNPQGWTLPQRLKCAIIGGALWVNASPRATKLADFETVDFQVYDFRIPRNLSKGTGDRISSPTGLGISAATATKVRMRIRNLSPGTDGFVAWHAPGKLDGEAGRVRFTMKPYVNEWQDVTCHMDERWQGDIDRIEIQLANTMRGDVWFDWIEITDGPRRPMPRLPDFHSEAVAPRISLPEVSQEAFTDAFRVLEESVLVEAPVFGFAHPVMKPGGQYGENWWQLDSSVALAGVQWVDQLFAENAIRGFHSVQAENPDGRIDWQGDAVVRGQPADVSSLPRYFEAAYDVARRTRDVSLRENTYASMRKYVEWWLNPRKKNRETGLITGMGEESFGDPAVRNAKTQVIAPVDLNVAVAVGLSNTAALARTLGREAEALAYERSFSDLETAINRYMWNDARGAYFNYDVQRRQQRERMLCTIFDPLRLRLAPPDRVERLVRHLVNPELFNWEAIAVTSMARNDPDFTELIGRYRAAAWMGDVWTLRNLMVIAGLEDVGRHDLAAELAWMTVKAFNGRYAEFLAPSTGEGHGAQRYAWTASQFIQAIVEHLFGVDWDSAANRLQVFPRIPEALKGKQLSISRLKLPCGTDTRAVVRTKRFDSGETEVSVEIAGPVPAGKFEIYTPAHSQRRIRAFDKAGHDLPTTMASGRLVNAVGVSIPIARSVYVRFQ